MSRASAPETLHPTGPPAPATSAFCSSIPTGDDNTPTCTAFPEASMAFPSLSTMHTLQGVDWVQAWGVQPVGRPCMRGLGDPRRRTPTAAPEQPLHGRLCRECCGAPGPTVPVAVGRCLPSLAPSCDWVHLTARPRRLPSHSHHRSRGPLPAHNSPSTRVLSSFQGRPLTEAPG